jgi:hypothetical protein
VARRDTDRIITGQIAAIARRFAARGPIGGRDREEAVAALRRVSVGRTDLLAEHAGLCLGYALADPGPQATARRLEAELCIEAGADPDLVPVWRQTGYFRAIGEQQDPGCS